MTDTGCPAFVFSEDFRKLLTVQPAFAELEYHALAGKLDISQSTAFGFAGSIFVAEAGDIYPSGSRQNLSGYKVLRVDRETGKISDFIGNAGTSFSDFFNTGAFNKPVDVKFNGDTMYIVDYGAVEPVTNIMHPGSGKIWAVTRTPGVAASPTLPVTCPPFSLPMSTSTSTPAITIVNRPCPGMNIVTLTPKATSTPNRLSKLDSLTRI